MEKHRLIDKLRNNANISYKEAEVILEKSNWDILDAVIFLEDCERIQKPDVGIFYTNKQIENTQIITVNKNEENDSFKNRNNFQGIFEVVCRFIDVCNNIFLEIKKEEKVFLKLPLTVIIVMLFFAFAIIIPLMIVGLFFDIQFYVLSKSVNADKINRIFIKLSNDAKHIKEKIKRRD
ncbi:MULTISPECIES: hypothetical protein [Clostridium]|jgi:hypothetical protein|uniref:hypothetical protein n=1 Tax=Clostridium TaxID=1485 RepID=UPI0002D1BE3B|nr:MULTISPECIES: hypothetical protein [Clostridium]AXB86689.1 ubiquitin [Clostridium butyricum]ENZ32137.1 hypothetical protein HMPREF1084_02551 [Clostridium butyricum 60E.3]KIU05218.1 UBA/TS-N domain-containing protein [Clostridium butyricum]MBA8969207.1 hypothetical protein [Clostridium butyricum]MBA8972935.1 hypothetical protein [Clostridium butyricum]